MNIFDELFSEAMLKLGEANKAINGTNEPLAQLPKGFVRGTEMTPEWMDKEIERMYGV